MEPGLRLWLVRHGQTAWNASGLCLGRTDLNLNQYGVKMVKALKKHIDIVACDAVYSSPTKRALETARILTTGYSKPIQMSKDLQEVDFGVWEGQTWENITGHREKEWDMWRQDPVHSAPHGGESLEAVAMRMMHFYRTLLENHEGQTILIVGHGGCLNIFLCTLLQVPLNYLWTFRLNPASFSEIVVRPQGPMLVSLNIIAPLEHNGNSMVHYGKSEKVETILRIIE